MSNHGSKFSSRGESLSLHEFLLQLSSFCYVFVHSSVSKKFLVRIEHRVCVFFKIHEISILVNCATFKTVIAFLTMENLKSQFPLLIILGGKEFSEVFANDFFAGVTYDLRYCRT